MPDELTDDQIQQISDALASNRKIEAIKIYREATGKGLKEAKDFVEALIPRLKEQDPEKYAAVGHTQTVGCGSAVLLCLVAAGALAVWMT